MEFLEKGYVYRGLKPVYWCIYDRTALAEAEVEYETTPALRSGSNSRWSVDAKAGKIGSGVDAGDLDHYAVDASLQPRAGISSGFQYVSAETATESC